jgi:hypothetical protein
LNSIYETIKVASQQQRGWTVVKTALIFVLSVGFSLIASAADGMSEDIYNCRYAAEAKRDSRVSELITDYKDIFALEEPKMLTETKCGTPICMAQVACLRHGLPMAIDVAVCKAIQKEGSWICPKAQICFSDKDVKYDEESLQVLVEGDETAPAVDKPAAAGADAGGGK